MLGQVHSIIEFIIPGGGISPRYVQPIPTEGTPEREEYDYWVTYNNDHPKPMDKARQNGKVKVIREPNLPAPDGFVYTWEGRIVNE